MLLLVDISWLVWVTYGYEEHKQAWLAKQKSMAEVWK